MKNTVLLDSDLNTTIMCNRNNEKVMWDTNSKMHIEMNNSLIIMRQKYLICNLGEFWFIANSMQNALRLSFAANKHRNTIKNQRRACHESLFS